MVFKISDCKTFVLRYKIQYQGSRSKQAFRHISVSLSNECLVGVMYVLYLDVYSEKQLKDIKNLLTL